MRLLTNPALCEEMARANREKVKEFAPEVVARQSDPEVAGSRDVRKFDDVRRRQ